MKKILTLFALVALAGLAAHADSLAVNGTAAMGGSFGLEVIHDNASAAFVQDDTPSAETVYRFEFLFDANDINNASGGGLGTNWRQSIFNIEGPNPRPNNPGNACPNGASVKVPVMRLFAMFTGGNGQNCSIQPLAMGNICTNIGTLSRVAISCSGPQKICGFLEIGSPGRFGATAVAVTDPCPPDGDPAYTERDRVNNETNVDRVKMGIPGTNAFGAGENGSLFYDEFASFRTLAP